MMNTTQLYGYASFGKIESTLSWSMSILRAAYTLLLKRDQFSDTFLRSDSPTPYEES